MHVASFLCHFCGHLDTSCIIWDDLIRPIDRSNALVLYYSWRLNLRLFRKAKLLPIINN